MVIKRYEKLPKKYFLSLFLVLFLTTTGVNAVNHVIRFGGTLGNNYSPSELSVAVGDTVTWQGNFGFHPLSSTIVPQGAGSFNPSGKPFFTLNPGKTFKRLG